MNQNTDIAVNSIKIISNMDSVNKNTGCLILNGGMVCKKKINCKTLITDDLVINENTNMKNLTVDNLRVSEIEIKHIHSFTCDSSEVKNLNINKLLPIDYKSSIGENDKRFDIYSNNLKCNFGHFLDINSNTLNIAENVSFTNSYKNKVMISTNKDEGIININCDIIQIKGNFDNFEVTDDGLEYDGLDIYRYLLIDSSYEFNEIYPSKSMIIISDSNFNKFILSVKKFKTKDLVVKDGSYIKVINIDDEVKYIFDFELKPNNNLEFIFIGQQWILINKDISNNINDYSTIDYLKDKSYSEELSVSENTLKVIKDKFKKVNKENNQNEISEDFSIDSCSDD
mgnify:FL=1|tara:strand:- start:8936 stop:9958 length:1023 start_codon:yes stop_codon:yes gene_type:complete